MLTKREDVIYKSCRRLVVVLEDTRFMPEQAALMDKYDIVKLGYNPTWTPETNDLDTLTSLCQKLLSARGPTRAWYTAASRECFRMLTRQKVLP